MDVNESPPSGYLEEQEPIFNPYWTQSLLMGLFMITVLLVWCLTWKGQKKSKDLHCVLEAISKFVLLI